MSSYIPPEIITDILIRLPVKSLLRFRCVSKLWLSIIDTNDFTKLHLRHSYSTSFNRTLVVDSVVLFYIDLDTFERLEIGGNKFGPQTVVCSCDGLVLISFQFGNLALWNPATRKFNNLPVASLDDGNWNKVIYAGECCALGYDSKNDDYKVVKVIRAKTKLDGRYVPYETKVFSLKSNTWKRIKDFPYTLACCKRWGAYLNDVLHTVVNDSSQNCKVIMGFNIATEEHIELPKPGINIALASVEVMGGCLTAIAPGEWSLSEIWVMKEYGVEGSWTKLFSFFPPPLGNRCLNLVPLAYSKSGDKVLLNYDGICLKWYGLRNETFSVACVPGLTASFNASPHDPLFHAEFCIGSLVSPYSPAGNQYERQKMKGKEIEKQSADFLSFRFKLVL